MSAGAAVLPGLSSIKATQRREAPLWTEQGHPRPEGPAGGLLLEEQPASVAAFAAIAEGTPPLSLLRAPREKAGESWAGLAGRPSAGGGR